MECIDIHYYNDKILIMVFHGANSHIYPLLKNGVTLSRHLIFI